MKKVLKTIALITLAILAVLIALAIGEYLTFDRQAGETRSVEVERAK